MVELRVAAEEARQAAGERIRRRETVPDHHGRPWYQAKQDEKLAAQYRLWMEEGMTREGLQLELPLSAEEVAERERKKGFVAIHEPVSHPLLGQSEGALAQRVEERQRLVQRLRRFALLSVIPPSVSASGEVVQTLREAYSLDHCRSTLIDLLQALRVSTTLVVEAVHTCEREQREEAHEKLNLQIVKRAYSEVGQRELREYKEMMRVRQKSGRRGVVGGRSSAEAAKRRSLGLSRGGGVADASGVTPLMAVRSEHAALPGFETFSASRHQEVSAVPLCAPHAFPPRRGATSSSAATAPHLLSRWEPRSRVSCFARW